MTDDTFLLARTRGPTIEVAAAVRHARASLGAGAADFMAVPDATLERPWTRREVAADVRYGLFRQVEAIEAAAAELDRVLDGIGAAADRRPASRRIAAATIARWDLHGILAALDDGILNADPGGGEWTIRQTLGHIVSGQRSYSWWTSWWLSRPDGNADVPAAIPDEVQEAAEQPTEEVEGEGSLHEIRERLDAIMDLGAGRLGRLGDDELARPARWQGIAVDVGFRLGRWSSHLQEHTIQIEKTLIMLNRPTTEVERLVRLIHRAYGRLEAAVFALQPDVLERADDRGRTAASVFETIADELVAGGRSVREAAIG